MPRLVMAAVAAALVASTAAGQEPRFEVASVRPHRATDDVMFALQFHEGGRLTATGTVRMLIRTAYRLQESALEGASGWMGNERFDVDGRARRNATPDEMRVMLRALLRERFGLVLHPERRDAPVFALKVARSQRGLRRRPAAEECPAGACDIRFSPGRLSARGVTMTALASELSWWVDRIVIDQTSLAGRFDVELEWAPERLPSLPFMLSTRDQPLTGRVDTNAPSIFTAVREQLGLTLEAERGQVDVLVIERAARPSGN